LKFELFALAGDLLEREADHDLRSERDRLPILYIGFVSPLFRGLKRRLDQQRVSVNDLQPLHGAVFRDIGVKNYRALNVCLPGQERIDG